MNQKRKLFIITGMSGAGKSQALKIFGDFGFYCVDNLPVSLIDKFVGLLAMPGNDIDKVVLGLDARADQFFEDAAEVVTGLKAKGYPLEILFPARAMKGQPFLCNGNPSCRGPRSTGLNSRLSRRKNQACPKRREWS